jgi:nitrate/TMAO reductase-like tetraheme cytochrome c subunit
MGPLIYYASALFALLAVVLIALFLLRPTLAAARGGKMLAFIALFLLPVLATALAAVSHVERSKSTAFCLSCHVMEPYGKSLRVDDKDAVPAAHFQNKRIPRDEACFTCHTTYTMFGDLQAKMRGLHHVQVYYFGTIPKKIKLYDPYNNRECLHCHAGARSFEEKDTHQEVRADLASGKTSCLECHDTIHAVDKVAGAKMWKETGGPREDKP